MGETPEDDPDEPIGELVVTATKAIGVKEKMAALGADPRYGEMIVASTSLDELNKQIRAVHFAGSRTQLLAIVFQLLFKKDGDVRQKARETIGPLLEGLDLPDDFVQRYFTMYTDVPGTGFAIHHGEVPFERRDVIDQAADELMFRLMKEYLES